MAAVAPYHTTLPHVTKDNWRELAAEKRAQRDALIPAEWRLAEQFTSGDARDVTGVAKQCGILSEREVEITELDEVQEVSVRLDGAVGRVWGTDLFRNNTQLAERIANKTYSAVEVTVAFSKCAAIAQQLVNCTPT